ncbi:LOW QUALITY PROTEIN: telomeric repeat-binding factor 1 [Paramormyrops kingsleyae]|uniref:LOW QUALITY PROTEIN: telomeric repeat-binding factor 1 n=1 Tax=Paramormyrops kingsleyae TaxID=1676925 RepID=UPI003B9720B3
MEGNGSPELEKPAVLAVANSMIADFGLVLLCRYFNMGQHERFRDCLRWLEAFQKASEQLQRDHKKKLTVCSFLARVVDGKEQDVQYDSDERITPLMSAIPLWESLQDVVVDKALFNNIKNLLFIQAVAVHVERGDYVKAQWVLDWLKEEFIFSPNLKMKLSMILNKKDAYHTFLTTFSFVSLVENIKVFLDQFLEDHPSDCIFKAASKETQSRLEAGQMSSGDEESSENTKEPSRMDEAEMKLKASDLNQTVGASTSCHLKTRAKRSLFPKHNILPWRPDSSKKPRSSHHMHFNMRGKCLHLFSAFINKCWHGYLCAVMSLILCHLPYARWPVADPLRTAHRIHHNIPSAEKDDDCMYLVGRDRSTCQPSQLQKSANPSSRATRKKWTYEEDRDLKSGVFRYGMGNWAKILQEFDFEDRTNVMLKDRWRTLQKQKVVGGR